MDSLGISTTVLTFPGVQTSSDAAIQLGDWSEQHLAETVAQIVDVIGRLDLCIHVSGIYPTTMPEATQRLGHAILAAKLTVPHLVSSAGSGRSSFVTVTQLDGYAGLAGEPSLAAVVLGGLGGLAKTLVVENPELFCRAIDVKPGLTREVISSILDRELNDANINPQEIAHDGHLRRTMNLQAVPTSPPRRVPPLGIHDLLVVTGGGRGVTAECAIALAHRYSCELLLLGRTTLADEPSWAAGRVGAALKSQIIEQLKAAGDVIVLPEVERQYQALLAQREIRHTLARIAAQGGRARYLAVDILDRSAVARALHPYLGRITGVIHGAGYLADRLVVDKRPADIDRVLATKLIGLDNVLAALTPNTELAHVVLFSSVAGLFGNRGQADYAVANEALNRIGMALKATRPNSRVTSINWGPWDGGMVTRALREQFEQRGIAILASDTGSAVFTEQFSPERGDDTTILVGPPTRLGGPPASQAHGTAERDQRDPALAGDVSCP